MSEKQEPFAAATAVPVSNTAVPSGAPAPNVAMHLQEKQGAKCCGCWCDYRRAVIIIAIIFIIINLIVLVSSLGAFAVPGTAINIDDDEVLDIWEDGIRNQAIFSGIALFSAACALIGARQYNIYLVGFNIVWIIANFIAGIVINLKTLDEVNRIGNEQDPDFVDYAPNVAGYVVQALIALLFIYPHAGFIHEVKKGIMSPETYPREEYSCCCVDKRY